MNRTDIQNSNDAAALRAFAGRCEGHAKFYAARAAKNRTSTVADRVEHAEAVRLAADYADLAALATARAAAVAVIDR